MRNSLTPAVPGEHTPVSTVLSKRERASRRKGKKGRKQKQTAREKKRGKAKKIEMGKRAWREDKDKKRVRPQSSYQSVSGCEREKEEQRDTGVSMRRKDAEEEGKNALERKEERALRENEARRKQERRKANRSEQKA